jgi:AMP nucleosidase
MKKKEQNPSVMQFLSEDNDSKGLSEKQFAIETLERYSGCSHEDFCDNLLLTNFANYVDQFAKQYKCPIFEGSMFKVAHAKKERISIIDFKIGSPAAALVVDICSFLPIKANLLLGMCGGLRRRYKVGDYLVPVASIRDEGTSDYYFPPEVPALGNFLMSRAITEELEKRSIEHHIGTTFTTNKRFWEFNDQFKERLTASRAQGIEMECATLFTSAYSRQMSLGALLLISDMPLNNTGIKTKSSSASVFKKHMKEHLELGVSILHRAEKMLAKKVKGYYDRTLYKKS